MKKRRLSSWCIALVVGILVDASPEAGGSDALKANLDLPYDAFGSSEDEEEAPEVILFHGGTYEADAVVFCVDESRSMARNQRWEIQKREIISAITQLSPRSKFGLVFYGAGAYPFNNAPMDATEANKQAAIAFLLGRQLSLGTCLGPGVVKSLEMLRHADARLRTVIVAGDGRPTSCPFVRGQGEADQQEMAAILQQTRAANPGGKVRVHTIYVGTDNDPGAVAFMRELAALHGGTFRMSAR